MSELSEDYNKNVENNNSFDWMKEILANSPDIMGVVDKNGVFLRHYSNLNQVDDDYFKGKPMYDFFFPEFHALVKEKINKAFETGMNDYYELASDYNGKIKWYMTRIAPIKQNGSVIALGLYIRETTDLKEVQNKLRVLNEELEDRVQQRTSQLEKYTRRLEDTERLSISLRKARTHSEVLQLLGKQFMNTFNGDAVGIYEVEDQRLNLSLNLTPEVDAPQELTNLSDRYFFSLLNENQISIAQVPKQDHPDCQFCEFIHQNHMHTLVLVPIRAASTMVGVIYLAFRQQIIFSMDDEQLMRSFIEAGGNTIHRIQVMERLEKNIANRENELSVIYDIMSIASETVDQDEMLNKILERTLRAVNCGIGIIYLVKDQKIIKKVQIPAELPDEYSVGVDSIKTRSINLEELYLDTGYQFWSIPKTKLKCISSIIRSKGKVLGAISLLGECISEQDQEIIHLITSIADEIGLAVESTRLRKQAQETLIVDERQRLARDLHDSVSQSLYGLVLSADISKKLLKLKEFSTLEQTISDIETFALQSLREMRLMLFELRPLSFESEGLSGALELRLNTVERRAGLMTSLDIQGEDLLSSPLDLEIYRITTEALNNALKHSDASQIHVSLHVDPKENLCELKVIDNGAGFKLDKKETGGIGLISMKERAARVNGQLIVETNEGFGTMIRFICPLDFEKGK